MLLLNWLTTTAERYGKTRRTGDRRRWPARRHRRSAVVDRFVAAAAVETLEDRTLLAFHLWTIDEVFSNSDGTIQFIELMNDSNFEHVLGGQTFTTNANTFTFPSNLPSTSTANTTFLMATSGFSALPGAVTPDYVIPDNFFSVTGDSLNFASVNFFTFTNGQLPLDGVTSLFTNLTTATNSPQNFAGVSGSIDVSGPSAMMIDDGDTGYSTTSGWVHIPDAMFPTPEGRDGDMENSLKGTGVDVATWTFDGLTPGTYRVSATWSTHENRATNAPYSIFDGAGGTLLKQTLVDQEQEPNDLDDDGSMWEDLGVVTITGDTLVVELSDAADEYVIADAVRVEESPTAPTAGPLFKDDGDVSYSDSGWNVSPVLEGRLNDIHYQFKGTGTETATWSFTGLTPGNYTVAATWSAHPNRASDAPYTIMDGGDIAEIKRLNQKLAPDDFFDNGGMWENIAVVTISGTELVVELSNDADGFVIADAIRIAPTSEAPLPAGTIIDDGDPDPAFTTTVGWNLSPITEGRDGDIRFAAPGNGSRIATWTFSGLTAGTYRVSATWSTHVNRATNAPYAIFDGATPLGTVEVDQEVAPNDFSTLGSDWKDLMEVTITGDTLVVQLSNNANGFVIADAVRVQPVT